MKKRIVSFLLALVMAVSLLPVSAFAVEGEVDTSLVFVDSQGNQYPVKMNNAVKEIKLPDVDLVISFSGNLFVATVPQGTNLTFNQESTWEDITGFYRFQKIFLSANLQVCLDELSAVSGIEVDGYVIDENTKCLCFLTKPDFDNFTGEDALLLCKKILIIPKNP